MILYLDSSSIVKLHVSEDGSDVTREAVARAASHATSWLAYAEVRAALARARRGKRIRTESGYRREVRDFESRWVDPMSYAKVGSSSEVIRVAGNLAETHSLTGFDAVHLASAIALRDRIEEPVVFSSWDKRLTQAAEAEGFALAHRAASP